MNNTQSLHSSIWIPFLSACGACACLGLLTVFCEASPGFKNEIAFYGAAGPLSGKVALTLLGWFLLSMIFQVSGRYREVSFRFCLWVGGVALAIGFLGTFPPFFYLFSAP